MIEETLSTLKDELEEYKAEMNRLGIENPSIKDGIEKTKRFLNTIELKYKGFDSDYKTINFMLTVIRDLIKDEIGKMTGVDK